MMSESLAGDPPDVGELARLVERVRRSERRRATAELGQFLFCAVAVVGGGLLLLTRSPLTYAVLQVVLAVPVAIGAVAFGRHRRQVTE